ncbi:hypothetical protein OIV83_004529 [Microbotryomycetes sp. JL201]|nr:hypothetical protein OIV83_004529 [Microbotryomycetes sp. JL201]
MTAPLLRMDKVTCVSLQQVASLVKAKRKDMLIVAYSQQYLSWLADVRTSDYQGGHIRGSVNLSSRLFESNISIRSIIESQIKPRIENDALSLVVLHCMRSQYRGPFAASSLETHPNFPRDKVKVAVLEGGYRLWRKTFEGTKDEHDMIEYDNEADKRMDASKVKGVARSDGDEFDKVEEQHSVEIREQASKQ